VRRLAAAFLNGDILQTLRKAAALPPHSKARLTSRIGVCKRPLTNKVSEPTFTNAMGRPPRISRAQIVETARGVFIRRGFEAATLADIAGELKVTPAALLRHVQSKQALFAEAMRTGVVDHPPCVTELAVTPGNADPRVVLRRFAEQFVPFVREVLGANLAMYMHARSQRTALLIPFDTSSEQSPAQRGIALVSDYFQRASDAGRIRISDPRAAALLFIGHLHSYVLIHFVLNVTPVYPLDRYLDALIDLWVHGGIGDSGVKRARKKRNEESDPGSAPRRRRDGGLPVHAGTAKAKAARSGRNAGVENGERRLPGGRPRRPRSRR
jgi:AcrR family transcriptional regulator